MSDEEDTTSDGRPVWLVRTPLWRSDTLNKLIHRLDQRLSKRDQTISHERRLGPPSSRMPSVHVPRDMVLEEYHI